MELMKNFPALFETSNAISTISQTGTPAAQTVLKKMKDDLVLSKIDLSQHTFEEIVYKILYKGSRSERMALGCLIDPESTLVFPSAWKQINSGKTTLKIAQESIIYPLFDLVCEHFNVAFNGNRETVSLSILQEFGGLSFADYLAVFCRAMKGDYWKETQHIMTRGVNYEFIHSWFAQYVKEWEVCRISAAEKAKKIDDLTPVSDEAKLNLEKIHQIQLYRKRLQREADFIYHKWYKTLHESQVFNIVADVDGKEFVTDVYKIDVMTEDGIKRVLKRNIYAFLAYGDIKETNKIFEEYQNLVFQKYSKETNQKDLVSTEFKVSCLEFGRVLNSFPAFEYLRIIVSKANTNANELSICRYVSAEIEKIRNSYYEEYLPACIETNFPRLDLPSYYYSQILPVATFNGEANPFSKILQ